MRKNLIQEINQLVRQINHPGRKKNLHYFINYSDAATPPSKGGETYDVYSIIKAYLIYTAFSLKVKLLKKIVLCSLILVPFLFFQTKISAQTKQVTFKEISKQAGIDFRYTFGDKTYVNIIESSGSGITVFDYNNDGFMDIFMMNGTWLEGISDAEGIVNRDTPDALYRNNGDGTFNEVARQAGVDDRHWTMAAGAVDFDNDGDQDLYLLNYGPNVFYRNNGNGTFTDITDRLGLKGPEKLNGFIKLSIGASFFDYNSDGRLDVMVGNFLAFDPKYIGNAGPDIMPHPSEYKGQLSMLYEQQSDGTFKDVTEKAGLYFPDAKCMGLTIWDIDDDADMDIYQANDHHFNYMYINNNGRFSEVAISRGVAANSKGIGSGSMHASPADINGDGLIDILVTDLDYGAMYLNKGNGTYEDVVEKNGISVHLAGKGTWGSTFFDFDNDGDQDIIAANGNGEELILQLPILLENDGTGKFSNTGPSRSDYFRQKRSGRGLAVCDFDNDGDMDVFISHVDLQATSVLLRNEGGNRNHWLGLSLKSDKGPIPAISAKVIVTAGGRQQVLLNQWATSYLSANDPRLHIGLGKNAVIEKLKIHWSDGVKEVYNNIKADRYITIVQGKGVVGKQ